MIEIGIAGTFDLQNYGDLLFPIIAEAELCRRLGPVKLHRFSYFDRSPPDWPYEVTSLIELPRIAGSLDAMIVGGGHLIRFDKNVAPGYCPDSADIHHPSGYWLTPALIGLHHGLPVMWNAPGVVGEVPAWAVPLVRLAIGLSDYVAVRDESARDALLSFARGSTIAVVPDTCFGVARLVQTERPSDAFSKLRESLSLDRPYIIVQATDGLDALARMLRGHPGRFSDHQFILLSIGPILGDGVGDVPEEFRSFLTLPAWPAPLVIAELIGGAAAVVGSSLHLAITALAFGIPVFRPQGEFGGKYAVLSGHCNVHAFGDEIDADLFAEAVTRRVRGPEFLNIEKALDRHWDKIASCITAAKSGPKREAARLWGRLPGYLEGVAVRAEAEKRGLADQIDEALRKLDRQGAAISERDGTIAAQNAHIAGLDRRIAVLDQQIPDLERQIAVLARQLASAKEAHARTSADLKTYAEKAVAFQNSTSWKVTAPLRWLGRTMAGRNGTSPPPILRFQAISGHALNREPYEWAFVNDVFARRDARALVDTYPRDNFKTVKGYDGEKGYEYEARALINMGTGSPSSPGDLSEAWQRLAADLLTFEYRAAMTRLIGRDLMTAPMEAYVCHFGPGAWLGPHLDLKDKIMTHVFYFNEEWDNANGGCLNILRSADMSDSIAEIAPIVGNTSVLVRADNSWHSVSRVVNGCRVSRRSMNVIFYRPGAVSTMWPPGDRTPLHSYPPQAV